MRGAVTRIKQIGGWLYCAGTGRSLCKRLGRNDWQEIGPLPPAGRGEVGFMDFDAFDPSDIYAAGGKGDVWHYDGKAWKKIAFPSNMWVESVCCGADGFVYIGAQSGTVFRGRGSQWKMIERGELSLAFKDMVWFQDRVYATSDYGLWEIQGETVRRSDEPIEISRRKSIFVREVVDIRFEGCKLFAKAAVELERKVRRDADGYAFVTGNVVSMRLSPTRQVCLDRKP